MKASSRMRSGHRRSAAIVLLFLLLISSLATVQGRAEEVAVATDDITLDPGEGGQMTLATRAVLNGRHSLETLGGASITIQPATGVASFIRFDPLRALSLAGQSAESRVASFFDQYGRVFGAYDMSQLALVETMRHGGGTRLTYQQVYQDVPVFAGVLRAHLDSQGRLTAMNGTYIPGLKLEVVPLLTAERAGALALRKLMPRLAVSRSAPITALVKSARLVIYREGLLQGISGDNLLVYEVEISNGVDLREFLYVDANNGRVVNQISGIYTAKDRKTYDANNDVAAGPASILCRDEGDPASGDEACDEAHDYAGDTYDYFMRAFGRDGLDGAGMPMISYVDVCPSGPASCPWNNASWNGEFMSYGTTPTGNPWTADDTVAHEFGHGITDFTSNLIYQWQSGAINEAMSDIYGEAVDQLNGAGLDAPTAPRIDYPIDSTTTYPAAAHCLAPYGSSGSFAYGNVRWLQGEEDYLIRDMWAPSCYGDPDHVTHSNYWCSTADSGGVHVNSGIVNHHYALLTDGGSFNGQTIDALGVIKSGAIYFQAQSHYLTPASNFADLEAALAASCSDLIGIDLADPVSGGPSGQIISAADCAEVDQASAAVELATDVTATCGFEPLLMPDAPALCEGIGDGTVISYWEQDWETGAGAWTTGTRDVADVATFDTPDWAVVGNLPSGRAGQAMFVEDNPAYGNCADDTEAGVLYVESPAFTLPVDAIVPRLAIDHWVATEFGWDGGNVKISVNDGPWRLIPGQNFTFNAYNDSVGGDNPLAGEPAFTGTDGGAVNGSWGQSQINLLGLAAPGDAVRFRVEMGLDGCNGVMGWYVDEMELYSCMGDTGPVCGDSILDPGQTCDDGNSIPGDGCSATCQVEAGYACTDPVPAGPLNGIADPSFEGGSPNAFWREGGSIASPICNADCGYDNALSGNWFSWFGGWGTGNWSSVDQEIVIPAGANTLTFWLAIGATAGDEGTLELRIDGTPVISYTVADAPAFSNYTKVTADISDYADDGLHNIAIWGEEVGASITNFYVDDVSLIVGQSQASGSVCAETMPDVLSCNGVPVAFEQGIPDGWTIVQGPGHGWGTTDDGVCGSGAVGFGNYAGSGEAACVDTDATGGLEETYLCSPPLDLSDALDADLSFLVNYQVFGVPGADDFFEVVVSTTDPSGPYGPALFSVNDDHPADALSIPGSGAAETVSLAPYAGAGQVYVCFAYGGDYDWYAQVDDVNLSCMLPSITLTKTVGLDSSVCAVADALTVTAGMDVTYCYQVENSGGVALPTHDLTDSALGTILSGFPFDLAPGASVWVTATATITETTVNTATWTAYDSELIWVEASDTATVTAVAPTITLTKTVGLDGGACATSDTLHVVGGSADVVYCYTVENSGGVMLPWHTLEDDMLGTILDGLPFALMPGATVWVTATATLTEATVNNATWTAYISNDILARASDTATVTLETEPTDVSLADFDGQPAWLQSLLMLLALMMAVTSMIWWAGRQRNMST